MRTILIAEDDIIIAMLCKQELEHRNIRVVLANNGKEAISILEKEKFDLVLLDLLMPIMDGYSVLEYFKARQIRIPVVVVLTNLGQDMTKAKCRKLGAEDFIVKSDVDPADIYEKIKKYLPVR